MPKNKGTVPLKELIDALEWEDDKLFDMFRDENGDLWFKTCETCNGVLIDQSRQHCSMKCSVAAGIYKNNAGIQAIKRWWNSLTSEQMFEHQSHAAKAANAARWSKPGAKKQASKARKRWIKKTSWRPSFTGRRASAAGFRSDIGITVRSRWEANIARYLNWLKQTNEIIGWVYEPKRFWFDEIRSGVVSYLPDFQVFFTDDRHEWWEVKGYWDKRSKTAVNRFHKFFPAEALIIIDAKRYRELCIEFQYTISGWERDEKNDPR